MSRAALAALAVLLAVAAAAGAPSRALATPEVGIADDRVLLHGTFDDAQAVVAAWKAMGIEIVRIHARWVSIAPAPDKENEPDHFTPSDPDETAYNWVSLDRAVDLVTGAGMRAMLAVTGSGPLWGSQDPSRGNPRWKPDPEKFADFATAVAKRYGDRVDRYLIWNEPNQPGWLQPQNDCSSGVCVPVAPHIYRAIVRAAYPAIKRADPGAEVIMGTLAPRGSAPHSEGSPLRPLRFLRAMGCVDNNFQPLYGGPCADFHPAVADGFSYHPHGVQFSPDHADPVPDDARIADLPRLERTLDRLTDAGRMKATTGRFGLFLTEFGYQTSPPDPYSGVTPSQQSAWLQEAAYMAWRDPRVRNVTQYEWRDEPIVDRGSGARKYASWQSGLLYANGREKPALATFINPFFIDTHVGGGEVRFWGQVRPGGTHEITLLRRVAGTSAWAPLLTRTTDDRGFWTVRRKVSQVASYRFTYDLRSRLRGSRLRNLNSATLRVAPADVASGTSESLAAKRARRAERARRARGR